MTKQVKANENNDLKYRKDLQDDGNKSDSNSKEFKESTNKPEKPPLEYFTE